MAKKIRIYSATNAFQVHLVASALAQAGIDAEIRNEALAPLAGAIPMADMMPQIWVDQRQVEAAKEVLSRIEPDPQEQGKLSLADQNEDLGRLSYPPEDRVCPNCGEDNPPELLECWNCQTDLVLS